MAMPLIHLPHKNKLSFPDSALTSFQDGWPVSWELPEDLLISPLLFETYQFKGANARLHSTNRLQVVSTENIKLRTLTCGNCNYFLGSQSESQEGNRLWKSRLKITTPSTSKPTSFDSSIFIAAQLLQLVESSISRRVIVHADDSSPGLLTWIFNPDIYYSSSKRGPTVHRAMKIFYQTIPDPISLLETVLNTHEELVLPAPELDELKSTLEASTNILPQSAQTFQDWRVGLLDRYETRPSGMGAMDQNALNHPAPESIQLFKSHLPEGWQELYL